MRGVCRVALMIRRDGQIADRVRRRQRTKPREPAVILVCIIVVTVGVCVGCRRGVSHTIVCGHRRHDTQCKRHVRIVRYRRGVYDRRRRTACSGNLREHVRVARVERVKILRVAIPFVTRLQEVINPVSIQIDNAHAVVDTAVIRECKWRCNPRGLRPTATVVQPRRVSMRTHGIVP